MKRSTGTPVNLLPLLDVLLCTMGTLIVVLGVLNRLARTHAVSAEHEEMAIAKEQVTLRIEQLTTAREKTIADLDEARRQLSAIEEHSRELDDKLRAEKAAEKQLVDKEIEDKRAGLRQELAQLNAEREKLDRDLKATRESKSEVRLAFSIVPFDGVYKTNRRPIYIECRDGEVILQPEGIVFNAADFSGPDSPSNPLASALRAAQEYWSEIPPPAPDINNEAYPLLLVRPDGVIAYILARGAMASWNTEFGYEMISQDGKLDYLPQPEPRLAELERRAVAEARQRLEWLAQVSPEAFVQRQPVQYRLSSMSGGLVRDGAPSLGNDPFANDPLGGFGRHRAGGSQGNSDPGSGGGGGGNPTANGLADARGNSVGGYGNSGIGGNGNGDSYGGGQGHSGFQNGGSGYMTGAVTGGSSGGAMGSGAMGSGANQLGSNFGGNGGGSESTGPQLNGSLNGGATASGNGERDGTSATAGGSTASGGNYAANGRFELGSNASSANGSTSGSGSSGSSSSGGSSGGGNSESSAGSSAGQPGGGGSSDSTPTPGVMPSPNFTYNASQPERSTRKLADKRGRNWALQNNATVSVPITRPIRVECWNDRLVLMPDGSDQQPQVIPLADHTEEAVDQLVAAVRVHTQAWGLAGHSMYWKPQLVLDVKPTAESRAGDLQVLLADSGLDVKRK